MQNLYKQVGDQSFFLKITEHLHAGLIVFGVKRNTVNSNNIVLQRISADRLLGVFYIRRDDHKVSAFNGMHFIAEQKPPLPRSLHKKVR